MSVDNSVNEVQHVVTRHWGQLLVNVSSERNYCDERFQQLGASFVVLPGADAPEKFLEEAANLLVEGSEQSGLPGSVQKLQAKLKASLALVLIQVNGQITGVSALKGQLGQVYRYSEAGYIALASHMRGGIGACLWAKLVQTAWEPEFNLNALFTDTLVNNYPSLKMQYNSNGAEPIVAGFFEAHSKTYVLSLFLRPNELDKQIAPTCSEELVHHFQDNYGFEMQDTLQRESLHAAVQNLPDSDFMTPARKQSTERKIAELVPIAGKLVVSAGGDKSESLVLAPGT